MLGVTHLAKDTTRPNFYFPLRTTHLVPKPPKTAKHPHTKAVRIIAKPKHLAKPQGFFKSPAFAPAGIFVATIAFEVLSKSWLMGKRSEEEVRVLMKLLELIERVADQVGLLQGWWRDMGRF